MHKLALNSDLFAILSFICKWVKNSELCQAPLLSPTTCYGIYFLCLPLVSFQWQPKDPVCVRARVCVCVWMPLWCLPNRLKMFPEPYLPPLPAGQHCCLRLWAGLELHQTGNLRVALVIQASPCLIPHKQTPTPHPPTTNTTPPLFSAHTSALHPPPSLAWQQLTHHTSLLG